MPQIHVCRPGDCLARVAWSYLLEPQVVSGHPDNRALLSRREDPNMLFPGDTLVIPDGKQPKYDLPTGQHHRLALPAPPKELRLVVRDRQQEPVANQPYTLLLDDVRPEKRKRTGTTDGDGMLCERIPIKCMGAVLEVADWRIRLRLGFLHPLPGDDGEPASGVESRLRALGYAAASSGRTPVGKPRVLAPGTRLALALFQTDQGLEATGDLDTSTLDKIKEGYGC